MTATGQIFRITFFEKTFKTDHLRLELVLFKTKKKVTTITVNIERKHFLPKKIASILYMRKSCNKKIRSWISLRT